VTPRSTHVFAFAIGGLCILSASCGSPISLAPVEGMHGAEPVLFSPATCMVIYVGEVGNDPRVDCLRELVYAEFLRRGYFVYNTRDSPWPEVQPPEDVWAVVRVDEAGRRLELLLVDPPAHQTVATSELTIGSAALPTRAEIAGLVTRVATSPGVTRLSEFNRPCADRMDRTKYRTSPPPSVDRVCALDK
jgi:hypothetical protein